MQDYGQSADWKYNETEEILHGLPRSEEEIAFDPQPGDVFRTSWGYDQTNTEFFEIVSRTAATVTIRPISARLGEHEEDSNRLYPIPGSYGSDFHIGTEKKCRLQKKTLGRHGEPRYVADRLVIDDVRYAWPYSTGGGWDTVAAGQPGH